MLTQFFDAVSQQHLPCQFHELSKRDGATVGVALIQWEQQVFHVPMIVCGEVPRQQFAAQDWTVAQSVIEAERMIQLGQVMWINVATLRAASMVDNVPACLETVLPPHRAAAYPYRRSEQARHPLPE